MKNSLFNNTVASSLPTIITQAVADAYSCSPSIIQLHINLSMAYDECFDHVINKAKKIDHNKNIEGWIYRVSLNKCRDIQKAKKHTIYLEEVQLNKEEEDTLLLKVEKEKKIEAVESALEKLNPMSKKVIKLRFMNESTYEDISRQTGLSINSVRQTILRGKKNIQQKIITNQQLAA